MSSKCLPSWLWVGPQVWAKRPFAAQFRIHWGTVRVKAQCPALPAFVLGVLATVCSKSPVPTPEPAPATTPGAAPAPSTTPEDSSNPDPPAEPPPAPDAFRQPESGIHARALLRRTVPPA